MSAALERAGRRFARVATRASVASPRLWPLLRPLVRRQFDALAPSWDARRSADSMAPLAAALERLEHQPARILDLGTGTGRAARFLAGRYPAAQVIGVDLAPEMVEEANSLLAPELRGRVRYQVADAASLPFPENAFDLVVLANMIPFFDALDRVTSPEGALVVAFSNGAETPIYVPPETLERRLTGFTRREEVSAGSGTALLARR
ncbi:MAG: methyltransferase domain-containing protein [Thermoleophilia bacterium]|nr:methyltransferase domain-containing protein [Thermoleophilia bacterium]